MWWKQGNCATTGKEYMVVEQKLWESCKMHEVCWVWRYDVALPSNKSYKKLFKLRRFFQVLLDGKKFSSFVLIKNKLGCKLNTRGGSFLNPVMNFSIFPRSTLPLAKPVMNIEISVHNGFHKFRNHYNLENLCNYRNWN